MKINNLTADKLRKSILQLAIQGKLVKQNPDDEPASELVKKIYAEKQKLIAEGKIKKDKTESYIYKGDDNRYYEKIGKNEPVDITDDLPFDIPDSWEWIRLSNTSFIYNGNSINEDEKQKKYTNVLEGYNYIATKDISFDRKINYNNGIRIPFNTQFRVAPNGNVLMCIEGGSAGRKIAILNEDVCFGNKLACFHNYYNISKYLFCYLQSPAFSQIFKGEISGIIGGVSINTLKSLFLPLPPLAEQQRIVEKIESMEPYLVEYDKIEKQLTKLESDIKDKLKKSILQYAIQGKLVKQDPNDEPASVLLERIKAEKEQLIKEGKIKRDKNESFIYKGDDKNYYENINGTVVNITEEIPFDIPNSWIWTRLPNISNFNLGKTPERDNNQNWGNDFPWVSIADMKNKSKINYTKEKISNYALVNKFNNQFSPKGTLIMSFKLTVGRTSLLDIDAVHNEAIISIFPYVTKNNITKMFLFNLLGSLVEYCDTTDAIKGSTLNKDKLNKLLIPQPPLIEQQRIVEKINIIEQIIG